MTVPLVSPEKKWPEDGAVTNAENTKEGLSAVFRGIKDIGFIEQQSASAAF